MAAAAGPGRVAKPDLLRSYRFRREREQGWRELEELIGRADRSGLQSLGTDELYRLPVLYRAVLSSLSVARAISLDRNVVSYLQGLAARAYVFVYGSSYSVLDQISEFFRRRYPALVWSLRWWVAAAALLLLLGTASGYLLTQHDPERFHSFVSDAMAGGRSPLSTRQELLDVLYDSGTGRINTLSAFASFLFTNNARIGLSCFAVGFAAGVPVALLLFINGLGLGAFAAIYAEQGLSLAFWAWILPHGITELLAVCLCGAAGFRLGLGLVFPGQLSRLDSLARAGREAATVVVGTVVLFFVAALIEGFFRQLVHDQTLRYATTVLTALVWLWYFVRHGAAVAATGGIGDSR